MALPHLFQCKIAFLHIYFSFTSKIYEPQKSGVSGAKKEEEKYIEVI
jgi:hypothetical protein